MINNEMPLLRGINIKYSGQFFLNNKWLNAESD